MKKIPTLFVRNPENMKLVTQKVNPECSWLFDSSNAFFSSIKKDGTNVSVLIHDGKCTTVFKRRNPTREQKALGDEPEYIFANRDDKGDQYIFAAVDATDFSSWPEGDYSCEALGPKIQGGIESNVPCLYPFSWSPDLIDNDKLFKDGVISFDSIKDYLEKNEMEGIVFEEEVDDNHRYAKIKRRDFGFEWPVKK